MNIYPNPSAGQVFVEYTGAFSSLELMDNCGKLLYRFQLTADGPGKLNINLSDLEDGIYCLRLSGNNYTVVKKLVKQSGW